MLQGGIAMIHTEKKKKVKSIEFTLKQQPKTKRQTCQKCKKCSCLPHSLIEKELVK